MKAERVGGLAWVGLVLVALGPVSVGGQQHYPPLTEAEAVEVRVALLAMKANERGPYLRIRWFCADGSVQPPQGAACAERGGGVQHAEMSPQALALGPKGFHPGTVLTAATFEELLDAPHAHDRLTQLLLDEFLFEVDDGWVLRRARYYRGARQAEDEERAGDAFLARFLADPDWVGKNYWIARQLVPVIPHTGVSGGESIQRIRNLATELAQLEPAFTQIRVKIHSFPSESDVGAVAAFLRRDGLAPATRNRLSELHEALRRQYDRTATAERLNAFAARLRSAPEVAQSTRALAERLAGPDDDRRTLVDIGALSRQIRDAVSSGREGRLNLTLLELDHLIHQRAVVVGTRFEADPAGAGRARSVRLGDLLPYVDLAYGAGFLSAREREQVRGRIGDMRSRPTFKALEYRRAISYLTRAVEWSTTTVRSRTSPTLERYVQVEPRAAEYVDATLRGSPLLPFSRALARLAADADRSLGASHTLPSVDRTPVDVSGVRGLNPGVALGPLDVDEVVDPAHFDRSRIYLLPETTPELRPVAGVLTLDAGNLLSHVQLLARNLGIPNASIPAALVPSLRALAGRPVFFAVSPLGRVVLKDARDMTDEDRALTAVRSETGMQRIRLDTSRLDLTKVTPMALEGLGAEDSGVLVGPKAANLGALANAFPGRVAPGVALPFGMFVRHAGNRPGAGAAPLETLRQAYRTAARMRTEGASGDDVDRFMFERLAEVRTGIAEREWLPDMREQIVRAVEEAFGSDLSAGIFVRSDTNVEDLPQFSGAGLNLTLPNRRTMADLLEGIKQVWTSPFTERAYLWRRQILEEQGQVYPSVLLLESVPSEKSGVMITSGLESGGPEDLTIATGEGVGAAVDGEGAETILVHPDGSVTLLSQAKATVRRVLVEGGGARMVPALRPDQLLMPSEIRQLQDVAATWQRQATDRTPGRVWDFEFGFVAGRLWLFQVRPFVRFRSSAVLDRLAALDRSTLANAERVISMDEVIR